MYYRRAKYYVILLFLTFVLRQVFLGRWILPQSISLGPVDVRYYGLIMALAVGLGFFVAKKRAPQSQINFFETENLLFWTVAGGFIGARLYHVVSSLDYYWSYPLDVFKVWNGGLSIYGAIFGGLLALFVYNKLSAIRYPLSAILDWLTPSILIGQIIGRLGNMFNYELFGYPTGLPWKMYVPPRFRPENFADSSFFHPLFLYEALFCLLIWFLLNKFEKKFPSGGLFIAYLFLYNTVRFFLEFLRIDSQILLGFRQNAAISIIIVFVTALTFYSWKHYGKVS